MSVGSQRPHSGVLAGWWGRVGSHAVTTERCSSRSGVSPEELGHPSAKSLGGVVGLLNRDTIAVAGVTQPVWVVPY